MLSKGLNGEDIGYESDVYHLTSTAVEHLKICLFKNIWVDPGHLVYWQRFR